MAPHWRSVVSAVRRPTFSRRQSVFWTAAIVMGPGFWHLLSCIMHCISIRFFPLLLVVVELYHSWKKTDQTLGEKKLEAISGLFHTYNWKKTIALGFSQISNVCWIRIRSTKKGGRYIFSQLFTAIHCNYSVLLGWRCLLRWMVEILHQLGW